MPQKLTAAELLNAAFQIGNTPTEYAEYARVWNAAASALSAYCAEQHLTRPHFSVRNRFANRIWRELHPTSELGRDDA
jgi:hypothetical protein